MRATAGSFVYVRLIVAAPQFVRDGGPARRADVICDHFDHVIKISDDVPPDERDELWLQALDETRLWWQGVRDFTPCRAIRDRRERSSETSGHPSSSP
jgi:hypothetical protein